MTQKAEKTLLDFSDLPLHCLRQFEGRCLSWLPQLPAGEKAQAEYAYFRKLAVQAPTRGAGDAGDAVGSRAPSLSPAEADAETHVPEGSRTAANDSCFHQPDLIATPVGLHGRVVPGAEVDVAPAAGRALQGGTQLGGVGYVVGFLGVTPKLPEVEESKGLVKRRRDL